MKVKSLFIIALACVAFMAGCKKNDNNAAVEEILDSTTENEAVNHWTAFSQTYLNDMANVKSKLVADGFELQGVEYVKQIGSFKVYVQPTVENDNGVPTKLIYYVATDKENTFLCNREKFIKVVNEKVLQNCYLNGALYAYQGGTYTYNGQEKTIESWGSMTGAQNAELKQATQIVLKWKCSTGDYDILEINFNCNDFHRIYFEVQLHNQ